MEEMAIEVRNKKCEVRSSKYENLAKNEKAYFSFDVFLLYRQKFRPKCSRK